MTGASRRRLTPLCTPNVSEPVVSEPVVSGPVVPGPVVSEPVISRPVVSAPIGRGPVAWGRVACVLVGLMLSGFALVSVVPIAWVPGSTRVTAQGEALTEDRIRALTQQALASAAPDDPTEAILALDDQVRQRWGDFESFPIALLHREDITIDLSAPYMSYRKTLGDYLRINRPVADVPWTGDIVISVSPERIEAPDVVRIVVERAGQSVTPVDNRLRPMTFMNGRGEEAVLHSGTIRFPLRAFAQGASVTVTVVMKDGSTVRTALEDAQLRALK